MELESWYPIALALIAVAVIRYMPRLTSGAQFIKPEVLKKKLDDGEDVVVIDVRTDSEYGGDSGHVPGAVHLPLSDVKTRVKELGGALDGLKDQSVFVMCRTDNRAAFAARTLKSAGFKQIFVISGGMKAWQRKGFQVNRA